MLHSRGLLEVIMSVLVLVGSVVRCLIVRSTGFRTMWWLLGMLRVLRRWCLFMMRLVVVVLAWSVVEGMLRRLRMATMVVCLLGWWFGICGGSLGGRGGLVRWRVLW